MRREHFRLLVLGLLSFVVSTIIFIVWGSVAVEASPGVSIRPMRELPVVASVFLLWCVMGLPLSVLAGIPCWRNRAFAEVVGFLLVGLSPAFVFITLCVYLFGVKGVSLSP